MKLATLQLFALACCLLVGCQTEGPNPWSVQPYAPPTQNRVPQATYAPMPSILPAVDGSSEPRLDGGDPDELQRILDELDIE